MSNTKETPVYDLKAFHWNPKTRTFVQDAWNLEWMDEEYCIKAFPNMKEPFYIKNYKTGQQRLFTFVKDNYDEWFFEHAEDNIRCVICIEPF